MWRMDLLAEAGRLVEKALLDPAAAADPAAAFVARPEVVADPDAHGRGLRALALCRFATGDAVGSLELLDRGAEVSQHQEVRAEIALTRVGPLAELGRIDDAREAAAAAVAGSTGLGRARAEMQRAVLAFRLDGLAEAVQVLDGAEPQLVAAGDDPWLVRLWANRAQMRAFRGDYRGAEADARRAVDRAHARHAPASERGALLLLAELAGLRGDLVGALGLLDRVGAAGLGFTDGHLEVHRASILLAAQLTGDAVASLAKAVTLLDADGLEMAGAESRVALAEALRLDGRLDEAAVVASSAIRMLATHGRSGWAEHARLVEIQARMAQGQPVDLTEALELSETMLSHGLAAPAVSSALRVMEAELIGGGDVDFDLVRRWARRARSLRRPDLTLLVHHVMALVYRAAGNRRAALRRLAAGLDTFDEHQATLGATEARVHVTRRVERLARTGMSMALESGRPSQVFRWMERTRAAALRRPPVVPPENEAMAVALAELRRAEAQRAAGADPTESDRRQRDLRQRIRRLALAAGDTGEIPAASAGVGELVESLDGSTLVEMDEIDGRVVAVALSAGGSRLWDAGTVAELSDAADGLRFALRRLATPRTSPASREAAWEMARTTARLLDERLLAPARPRGPVVLSPPARFHVVPWPALPGLAGRPVSVTPSAWLWHRRCHHRHPGDGAVLVAGPELANAPDEVRRIAAIHSDATVLVGEAATVERVTDGLAASRLAHLACHGTFRGDNPLFSSLLLADGGLNVYQLERLRPPPEIVVLPACDAGLTGPRPGNELMGMVAGLLGGGTRSVVASVGLFPDSEAAVEVMEAFHRRLSEGWEPAVALAGTADETDDARVARLSLVCFGV